MSYTDASALAAFLPANQGLPILTASSFPNLNGAATIIAMVSAELDGAALAAGYSVPIPSTASAARLQMSQYTLEGAAARALRTLLPHLAPNDQVNYASILDTQYRQALDHIRQGHTLLVDAPRDTGAERPLPRSNFTKDPTSSWDLPLTQDFRP
jgi:hypothetical protein